MKSKIVSIIETLTYGAIWLFVIYFVGTTVRGCSEDVSKWKSCNPKVIRIDNPDDSSTSNWICDDDSEALPPEKVKINEKEIVIVRCICKDKPAMQNEKEVSEAVADESNLADSIFE